MKESIQNIISFYITNQTQFMHRKRKTAFNSINLAIVFFLENHLYNYDQFLNLLL